MAEPRREQVLNAMAAQLATISVANGYLSTVKRVTRSVLQLDAYNEWPIIGLTPALDSRIRLVAQREAYEVQLGVTIRGYVRGNDQVSTGTAIENLSDDVTACLLAKPGLGVHCQILSPGPPQVDDGVTAPLGAFSQRWTALWWQAYRVAA